MANRKTGPDRLGGAQPPSSGGYGDIDGSAQHVDESHAPEVKDQAPSPEKPTPPDEIEPD